MQPKCHKAVGQSVFSPHWSDAARKPTALIKYLRERLIKTAGKKITPTVENNVPLYFTQSVADLPLWRLQVFESTGVFCCLFMPDYSWFPLIWKTKLLKLKPRIYLSCYMGFDLDLWTSGRTETFRKLSTLTKLCQFFGINCYSFKQAYCNNRNNENNMQCY